jgi:class 3 adenylate cyclase
LLVAPEPWSDDAVSPTGAIRYAKTGDGFHLAFAVLGAGPIDLMDVGNGTNMSVEAAQDEPGWESYLTRLSSFARLLRFDMRGIGLSDPLPATGATIEQWANDTLAVMDAAGSEEAALMATGHAGPSAIFLAAAHPEKVRALVLINAYARIVRAPDYPPGVPLRLFDSFVESLIDPAGANDPTPTDDLPLMVPSRVGDRAFQKWWREAGRRGASPAAARAMHSLARGSDVRDLLPRVHAPTLVLHTADNNYVRAGHGRYLAAHIHNAAYAELPGRDHLPWAAESDFAGEMEEFLTGTRHAAPTNRRLAAVVFTDIVGSTEEARRLGDHAWRERLDRHDLMTERQVTRFGGELIKTMGDGALASFDGPASAIRCASAIIDAVAQLGLTIRTGIHVGEIEQRNHDIAGIAVHVAQRICSAAQPQEILVSRTVADLTAGSDIAFVDRGEHELKGVTGTWQLFAVQV